MKPWIHSSEQSDRAVLVLILGAALIGGCSDMHDRVVAVTGTNIGISVAENPQTMLYEAKLGYNRAEFALVPTNRSAATQPGKLGNGNGGAKDSPNVLMEINQSGIFSKGNGGIYQRLAVGDLAVAQPGAALMVSKSPDGAVDPATAKTILENTKGGAQPPGNLDADEAKIANAVYGRPQADVDALFHSVKRDSGASFKDQKDFQDAAANGTLTDAEAKSLLDALKKNGWLQPATQP